MKLKAICLSLFPVGTQLIVLSDNLYFPVFVRLLDSVWLLLLKDMELMIVPPINEVMEKTFVPNDEYRKLIPEFLEVNDPLILILPNHTI